MVTMMTVELAEIYSASRQVMGYNPDDFQREL